MQQQQYFRRFSLPPLELGPLRLAVYRSVLLPLTKEPLLWPIDDGQRDEYALKDCQGSAYHLGLHVHERFFPYFFVYLAPICSFPLETCTREPGGDVLQDREDVYPELSRYSSFSQTFQCNFSSRNIWVV